MAQKTRIHYPVTPLAITKMLLAFHVQLIWYLPQLLKLRKFYKQRTPKRDDLSVALIGDNLDEVNGIALNARTLIRTLRKKNRKIYLIGAAFRSKRPRFEMEKGSIFMVPVSASMDMPGYEGSEVTIPKIGVLLRLLRRYPVDLFEFETPNTMGWMGMWIGKIVGIKTISHYRTDIVTYIDTLIDNKFAKFININSVYIFTRLNAPVIVPSAAFIPIVHKLGVPLDKIHHLPRGVNSVMFHPHKKKDDVWKRLTPDLPGFRLIYVGRVSTEKNLPWLVDMYTQYAKINPHINLTVVGEGPYLEEMKRALSAETSVHFTGTLRGQELASIFACADLLVFPSTTDTFGNSVIEAIASGVPCVVSDKGGPQEIIENGISGIVINPTNMGEALDKIHALISDTDKMQAFKKAARDRSLLFTQEHSADKFWEFYQSLFP